MDGTWIEVRVITKSEALEPVSGIFYSLDCKGVAIEDPEDILGREQGPLTWDFADINVLFRRFLLDSQLAAIEAAFGAYPVVEYRCAAVRAGYDRGNDCFVVSSTLVAAG